MTFVYALVGTVPLKATVNGTRDKFESGQTDEFVVETAEIGDLKKLRLVFVGIEFFNSLFGFRKLNDLII